MNKIKMQNKLDLTVETLCEIFSTAWSALIKTRILAGVYFALESKQVFGSEGSFNCSLRCKKRKNEIK
jgi:hypothetical protein